MKLPWDEKYLRISFHVIFTFIVIYVLYIILGAITYGFTNMSMLMEGIGNWLKGTFSLLSPVLTAFLIAYMLDPAVDVFQKGFDMLRGYGIGKRIAAVGPMKRLLGSASVKRIRRLNPLKRYFRNRRLRRQSRRSAGVAAVIVIILLILALCVLGVLRVTSSSALSLDTEYVQLISKTVNDFNDVIFSIQTRLADIGLLEYMSDSIDRTAQELTGLVSGFSDNIIKKITSAGSGVLTFMLAFVVSVYYLRDKAKYLSVANEIMDAFIPRRANTAIRNFLGDIDAIFSGYIRGQLTDALIMAVLIGAYLSIINVRFSIIIGIFSGISNLIPYFGAIIAFILSVAVAFLSGDPIKAVYAAAGIVILQQIDGMFIVPRVVGAKVELSPVLVIISLSIAGSAFGLVGMLLAVPVCAIIKLLLARVLQRQKQRSKNREDINLTMP